MKVEIVTTGSELLLGEIVNTNAAYMAQELNKLGFDTVYQTTIGDNRERMEEAIRHALSRADLVLTSGGLGPTLGDITKDVCAGICGRAMHRDDNVAKRIEAHCKLRGYPLTENNLRMAMVPDGARIFLNEAGTAPGIVLEQGGKWIVNLPGPPHEMKEMFQRSLKPFLEEQFGISSVIVSRELYAFGIGESQLETKISALIKEQYETHNPTLALLVRPEGVLIRITAKAVDREKAQELIAEKEQQIRAVVGECIFGADGEGMENAVGKLLVEKNYTIACAESCTGGLVTSRLTDVAGSSAYVLGSIISYANEVKAEQLGVSEETLRTVGAVSEETARQMAEGVRRLLHADIGISTTGIAGPGGATEEKPVGLVYTAVATADGTTVQRNIFSGDRRMVKFRASQAVLDMVRKKLLE